MKYLIIFTVFSFSYLQAHFIAFLSEETDLKAISFIEKAITQLYAEELFTAGLCLDKKNALQTSQKECSIRDPEEIRTYNKIILEDGSVCGYLVYSVKNNLTYLDALFLKENFRGQGIGKQALLELEKKAIETKAPEIELYVFSHNKAAYALYKKVGYVVETIYFQNDKIISYHLKKKIN